VKKLLENPVIRMAAATLLIIAGILGLVLPLAPGIALIVGGLYLINPKWVKGKIARFLEWIRRK
jgi:uncharacterized protein YqgC (DUF456 family)